jgi:hypothetical protein
MLNVLKENQRFINFLNQTIDDKESLIRKDLKLVNRYIKKTEFDNAISFIKKSQYLLKTKLDGLSWKEWEEKYKPIKNHLSKHEDVYSFETFGEELEFVKQQNYKNIWTLFDLNDYTYGLGAGFHLVNRNEYYITEKEWENENILILDSYADQASYIMGCRLESLAFDEDESEIESDIDFELLYYFYRKCYEEKLYYFIVKHWETIY